MKKGDTFELAARAVTVVGFSVDEKHVWLSYGGQHVLLVECLELTRIGRHLFGAAWEHVLLGKRIGSIVLGKARGEHAGVHAIHADMFGHGRILTGEIPWR